jgi:hypothetical protein
MDPKRIWFLIRIFECEPKYLGLLPPFENDLKDPF